jgi:hypothetical protein
MEEKPLLIAPANLIPQWQRLAKLNDAEMDFISTQKLARDGGDCRGYKYLIIDELGEFTSKSKAFKKIQARKNSQKLVLSATPERNKVSNWYGITRLVFPDFFSKGYTYYAWAYEYCDVSPAYYGSTLIRVTDWKQGTDNFTPLLPLIIDADEPEYDFEIFEEKLEVQLTDVQQGDIYRLKERNFIYKNGYFDIPSSTMQGA